MGSWGDPTLVATHTSDASARLCVKLGLRQYVAAEEVREGEIGSIFDEIKNLVEPIESPYTHVRGRSEAERRSVAV